ncbi:Sb-PDE family phosphodiesterase [Pelagerythrobacter marensis]|uniref:Uncharacterized protein n=1 Tax=Pelagerythrobacter marensis TaxID=543877 RepID=A0A0G3X879_9SPHN|nr:Sb-PDE family phosphodiesterase [Pelagerythrobacter marensis]AKM07760.1 hypothetical protein AM2010_1694 [Pelagerythrobacter marensis]
MKLLRSVLCAVVLAGAAHPAVAETFSFPDTPDGRKVLAVDFHIHTVFSDGTVWPNIRVTEAMSEGLSAISLTEHIELTVQKKYLAKIDGLVDKNQAHAIARDYSESRVLRDGQERVNVIRGAEITRGFGHFNCIYTTDNNRLHVPQREDDPAVLTDTDAASYVETVNSLAEANRQGAFCFWNHPYAPGQNAGSMAPRKIHREMLDKKLIGGIEVANGGGIFYDAIDTAMKYDLAIIGGSDIHGPARWREGSHRTVTLVLAQDLGDTAMKEAVEARQTVALYSNTLIGRSGPVTRIIEGALTVSLMPPSRGWHVMQYPVKIENGSSMPFTLEIDPRLTPFNQPDIITVDANSAKTVVMFRQPDEALGFKARVLNTHVDGRHRAQVTLPFE